MTLPRVTPILRHLLLVAGILAVFAVTALIEAGPRWIACGSRVVLVTGRVVDPEHGCPIEGVRVMVRWGNAELSDEVEAWRWWQIDEDSRRERARQLRRRARESLVSSFGPTGTTDGEGRFFLPHQVGVSRSGVGSCTDVEMPRLAPFQGVGGVLLVLPDGTSRVVPAREGAWTPFPAPPPRDDEAPEYGLDMGDIRAP